MAPRYPYPPFFLFSSSAPGQEQSDVATYAGVTFEELAEDKMWRPAWERKPNVEVRHIPYGARDDVQAAGLGNPTLTLRAKLSSDNDMDTLIAVVGATGRALSDLFTSGNNFSNVRLIEVANIQRWDGGAVWTCKLVFMREGS